MEPWLAALIILGVAALSAAGMLLVRRRAPAGTFFKDPIRAVPCTRWQAPPTW